MASEIIDSNYSDVELAYRLHRVLVAENTVLTLFRKQLLDVIKSNVEDIYTVMPDEDE